MLLLLALCSLFCQVSADEFPYEPPKNFVLSYQYIALHHPVSTDNIAAQLYFDQGLTLLYAFNHDAAYWSFLRSSEADPELAMAYWGMALVLGKNININTNPERETRANQLLQKALEHQSRANDSERAYIAALSKRYANNPKLDFQAEYSQAMRQLHAQFPDDPDAAVIFAESLFTIDPWHQWSSSGKPLTDTPEAVKVLEAVLKQNPQHLGANHYYIHAVEGSSHPEWALASAERLKHLLPASGHIMHMPSHIYILMGDYRKAALANEAAVAVDRAYVKEYGLTGIYPVHYLSHNLFVLSSAYAMEGNLVRAREAAEDLERFYLPHYARMPNLEEYASASLAIQLRFNRWEEILKREEPNQKMRMVHALWLYARGLAYASTGDLPKALEEQKRFKNESIPEDYNFGFNAAVKITAIADSILTARILEAQGNPAAAADELTKAIAIQDNLRYNESPDWYFPVRDSLGGLLLRTSKYAEAENVFRTDLEHHPRSGRSLFGLRESLKRQSRALDYYWVDLEFQKAWLYSDTDLTVSQL